MSLSFWGGTEAYRCKGKEFAGFQTQNKNINAKLVVGQPYLDVLVFFGSQNCTKIQSMNCGGL